MATKNKFYAKRIYLINRDLQLRYTYAAVLVGMVTTILTAIIILYPLYSFEILRIPKFLPLPILISMIFASIINILMVGYFGVIITHRIAGPVYALVKAFRRIGYGHWLGYLQVRQYDDLKYLVRHFNEMVDHLVDFAKKDIVHIQEIISLAQDTSLDNKDLIIMKLKNLESRIQDRLKNGSFVGLIEDELKEIK